MSGFRKVTDPAVLNRKPAILQVKQAPSGGTLASVLQSFGASRDIFDELSIINDLRLDDQVSRGELIKVVESPSSGSR